MRIDEFNSALPGQRGINSLLYVHDGVARIIYIIKGGISLPRLLLRRPKFFLSAMIAVCCMFCASADALEVDTNLVAKGRVAEVKADFSVPLSAGEVLDVLTDFEHMPQFVPDIHSAKLIREEGNHQLISLKGAVKFFFIEFPIDVVMNVSLLPGDVIDLQSVSGNMKVQGVMKVNHSGAKTWVTYDARLQPAFWLPPILGPALISGQIKKQFAGQIAEMDRRHGFMEAKP